MVSWVPMFIGTLVHRLSFLDSAHSAHPLGRSNAAVFHHSVEKLEPPTNAESAIEAPNVSVSCNFSDSHVIGVPPFSSNHQHTLCSLHITERTAGFMYFCDGMSKPADCPMSLNHMYGERKLSTFFDQSYMDSYAVTGTDAKAWRVYLTRPLEPFEGLCICYRTDGTKMTLRLSAGYPDSSLIGLMLGVIITITYALG